MEIETIHILGLPRSGTTIFYDTITRHPDLAYFFSKKYDKFMRFRLPIRPNPLEGYIWKWYHNELEYLTQSSQKEKETILKEFKKYCKWFRTDKFISKNPDNVLKIKWLESINPSKYIVLNRNRESTIKSIYHYAQKHLPRDQQKLVKYLKGFRGWVSILEKFGDGSLSKEAIAKYHDYLKQIQLNDVKDLPHIDINYEDFVNDPHNELKRCYEFLDIKQFNTKLPRKIINMNNKYGELR